MGSIRLPFYRCRLPNSVAAGPRIDSRHPRFGFLNEEMPAYHKPCRRHFPSP